MVVVVPGSISWTSASRQRVGPIAVPSHVDAGAQAARGRRQRHVLLADDGLPVLAPLVDELGAALLLDVVVRRRGLGFCGHGAARRLNIHRRCVTLANVAVRAPCCASVRRDGAVARAPLVERAKREGALTLYTSLAPTESEPLAEAFEKKYGVKVELWRALSAEVVQRVDHRGEGTALRRRRDRDQRSRDGNDRAREAARRAPFPAPRRPAGQRHSRAPHVVSRSDELLRRRLQHHEGEAPRDSGHVRGLHRPEVEGTHRARSDRRRMDGDPDQDVPGARARIFRKLAAMQPDVRKGHVLLASLVAAGEVPVGLSDVQQQRRDAQAQGRADRLRAGAAGGRASAGHRRGAERAASERRRACSPISSCRPKDRSCSSRWGGFRRARR